MSDRLDDREHYQTAARSSGVSGREKGKE